MQRCLSKPHIVLSKDNLIWTPLISNELQIYEEDEVYNVLFYDDHNDLDQAKGDQKMCPGKLKRRKRRRWNKAYNNNSKRRRKPVKADNPVKTAYDDDSQFVSAFENDDDDTEEDDEENENNSDDNLTMTNNVKMSNGGSPLESRTATHAFNNDESSCDKTYQNNDERIDNSLKSTPTKNHTSSPIKQRRSSSRSPYKKFKPDDNKMPMVNGGNAVKLNAKTNGKLSRNQSMEEDSSSSSYSEQQLSSKTSPTNRNKSRTNNYYNSIQYEASNSTSPRIRNLSNGVLY